MHHDAPAPPRDLAIHDGLPAIGSRGIMRAVHRWENEAKGKTNPHRRSVVMRSSVCFSPTSSILGGLKSSTTLSLCRDKRQSKIVKPI